MARASSGARSRPRFLLVKLIDLNIEINPETNAAAKV
jgi:hypothetical protein